MPRPIPWLGLSPIARGWLFVLIALNLAPFTGFGVVIAASFLSEPGDDLVMAWGTSLITVALACVNYRILVFETVTDMAVRRGHVLLKTLGGVWEVPIERIAAIQPSPWLPLRGILMDARRLELKEAPASIPSGKLLLAESLAERGQIRRSRV